MPFSSYTNRQADEILREFGSTEDRGLSSAEARRRLLQSGANEVKKNRATIWTIMARQFSSPFIYLLFGAALLSLFLREFFDAILIMLFIAVNSGLSFHQEYRSEKAVQLLQTYILARARVRRDGEERMIPSRELTAGDIALFEPGDIIPADVRILHAQNLVIDESMLTGESAPIQKNPVPLRSPATEMYRAANIGFSGTKVVSGSGAGVVIATGASSVVGGIGGMVGETKRVSSFEQGIQKLSSFILWLVLLTIAFVIGINIVLKGLGTNIPELLLFAIALAVSVVPEALPIVTTFCLSRGAIRLAKHHVVVKRLSAIEDLGSIDVLCTDKTGTLTENILTVSDTFAAGHAATEDLLLFANVASPFLSEKKREQSNAFDIALWKHIGGDLRKKARGYERTMEIPFTPERRISSVLAVHDHDLRLIVRGAPEAVMKLCHVGSDIANAIGAWVKSEGAHGKRTIAIAVKKLPHAPKDLGGEEHGMELLGAISFADPLKPTAAAAVKHAEMLGVDVKIITGDSPDVAGAVARDIGLLKIDQKVVMGDDVERMNEDDARRAVASACVFARVSPKQKYRIIQLLRTSHTVGFLGEGINDAPALKIAHVGMVVADASDIAREAADIILLQKSLGVIISGIEDGRSVFANTMKYIKATIAQNLGNLYSLSIATFLIPFVPMLPVQLLLVNLLSDFPMIAVASDTIDRIEVRVPRTYNIRDIALFGTILGAVSTLFDFIFFGLFFHAAPAVLQTNWFIGSILTELVFIFSVRTRLVFFKAKMASAILIGLSSLAAVVTILLPLSAFGREKFHFVAPTPSALLAIFAVVATFFGTTECVKLLYYRYLNHTDRRSLQAASGK